MSVSRRGRVFQRSTSAEQSYTGDERFDKAFVVRVSEPRAGLTILTPTLRSGLLELATLCPKIRIEKDYLRAEFPNADKAIGALSYVVWVATALRDNSAHPIG